VSVPNTLVCTERRELLVRTGRNFPSLEWCAVDEWKEWSWVIGVCARGGGFMGEMAQSDNALSHSLKVEIKMAHYVWVKEWVAIWM
jgi:hypothetical protein